MGLADYRRKRRFAQTSEPKGTERHTTTGRLFVIQQQAARNLHFDLRLEIEEVLKSWAVPNGISLDPADKRLGTIEFFPPLKSITNILVRTTKDNLALISAKSVSIFLNKVGRLSFR